MRAEDLSSCGPTTAHWAIGSRKTERAAGQRFMKAATSIVFLILTAMGDGGCSYLTARGRQEAAYARYVRHAAAGRTKMQRKFVAFPKLPAATPVPDPVIAAGAAPESISASGDSQ